MYSPSQIGAFVLMKMKETAGQYTQGYTFFFPNDVKDNIPGLDKS